MTSEATAAGDDPESGLVRTLLRIVVNDPSRLPENLAKFSHRMLSAEVPGYVARLRAEHPDADVGELERIVVRRGLRETSSQGGFVGGPFIVLVPVAFVAALLAQIKMLFRMAAVGGRDPLAPERAAEVLIIMGVYKTMDEAAAAIAETGTRPDPESGPVGKRSRLFATWHVIWRMAWLLGLLAPDPATPVGVVIHLARWLMLGLAFLVGTVVPLIWLPYLSFSYYRGTTDLAERASVFYSGKDKALHLERKTSAIPGLAAALLRALVSLGLIVGGVVAILALDVRIAGHEWYPLLILGVVVSSVTGAVWYLRRARSRRRETAS